MNICKKKTKKTSLFNIKWIPPPFSAIQYKNKQFCRGFFMLFHSMSESLEPLVHKRAKEGWELFADRTVALSLSLSTAELQSLRHTPGRLVKNILEMQTFISFASYQCSLSQPKCCVVALVLPWDLCQSAHPFFFTSCTAPTECSHCAASIGLLSPDEND